MLDLTALPHDRSDYLRTLVLLLVSLLGTFFMDQLLKGLPIYETFYEGVAAVNLAGRLNGTRIVSYFLLGLGCIVLDRWRGIGLGELPAEARALLIMAVGLQMYTIGLLDYNHYYNNWMVADRLLLVGLGVLAIVRPLYLPIFLIDLVLLTGQLRQPDLIGYDHVHKYIFPHILALAWCFLVASRFVRIREPYYLLVPLMMAPLSLWYIMGGIGKLELDWPSQNSLYNLFAAALDAGWLAGWSQGTKLFLADFLVTFQQPMLWSTIVLEILLPPLLFVNRPTAIAVSLTLMIFHLFVYLFSGILFWQWSLLELVFIYFLVFRRQDVAPLFSWRSRGVYWLTLLLLPLAVHIGKLAWYDCGFINHYAFFLVNDRGEETELDATYFSPYDTGFAKNRFYFLTHEKTLANTYGQCDDVSLLGLLRDWSSRSAEDNQTLLDDFRNQAGMERYDEADAKEFLAFLTSFISNKNAYDPELISLLAVPPHMQQGPNQRNLHKAGLHHLKVVYREKVILPGLRYQTVAQDSFSLSLTPPQAP
ncbi:hypothetical protein [Neolewinella sp.]|uniref:hypothetical protein n=1 Tax=Neolewinella sp. TaxID=2993543 RepID=UPI003B5172A1